jgi:lipopolysaccharide export system permease protein
LKARSAGAVAAIYGVPVLAIALSCLLIFFGPRVRAFNAALAGALRALFRAPRLAPAR